VRRVPSAWREVHPPGRLQEEPLVQSSNQDEGNDHTTPEDFGTSRFGHLSGVLASPPLTSARSGHGRYISRAAARLWPYSELLFHHQESERPGPVATPGTKQHFYSGTRADRDWSC